MGRVKVSHSKVPPSFIDEAIAAFKVRERTRQRHASGGEVQYKEYTVDF